MGNPLAKDFRTKIEQGVLRSVTGNEAETVLKFGNMCSYWKNNVDRIRSVRWLLWHIFHFQRHVPCDWLHMWVRSWTDIHILVGSTSFATEL